MRADQGDHQHVPPMMASLHSRLDVRVGVTQSREFNHIEEGHWYPCCQAIEVAGQRHGEHPQIQQAMRRMRGRAQPRRQRRALFDIDELIAGRDIIQETIRQ